MCAGSRTSNADTCEGDSGGPLLAAAEDHGGTRSWSISGITSFGTSCGLSQSSNYGVFTRVSAYMGWIESVCGENCSLPVEVNGDPHLRAQMNEIVSLKSAKDSSNDGSGTQLKRSQRRQERIKLRQEKRAQRSLIRAELRAKRQQQRRENRKSAGK